MSDDREEIEALILVLRDARDKAHWLAVHRRMALAAHVEQGLLLLLDMMYDVSGRVARKEKP
jgi:hypothetical protein